MESLAFLSPVQSVSGACKREHAISSSNCPWKGKVELGSPPSVHLAARLNVVDNARIVFRIAESRSRCQISLSSPKSQFFHGRIARPSFKIDADSIISAGRHFSVVSQADSEGLSSVDFLDKPAVSDNNVVKHDSRQQYWDQLSKGTAAASAATTAVHGGERHGRPSVSDSVTTPVVHSALYTFESSRDVIDYNEGRYKSYEYGRYGNPTTRVAEMKIAALEGAEDCIVSASGMNSVTTMLLALMPVGGHLITTTDCYRRTRQFIQTILSKLGVTTTVIDPADMATLESTLRERGRGNTTMFFSESPTNPYLRLIDIEKVSHLCHCYGAMVVIDSTFATPVNQRPHLLGADLVLHSATKFLAGHNDVLVGALAGRQQVLQKVRDLHGILGGVVDPHAAYLLIRGLKTLALRVERQNSTALSIARFLEGHPKVARVHYPGLESHAEHSIAVKQMAGFGGVVSFEIDGELERAIKFVDLLRIPYHGPSLGGVETLVEQPTVMSYWDQPKAVRDQIGIKDTLVRFSCGIEDPSDILADIQHALDHI